MSNLAPLRLTITYVGPYQIAKVNVAFNISNYIHSRNKRRDYCFINFCKNRFYYMFQVIGNLVYYQFLNAAIVAPDAFHIINLPNGTGLTTDQRKNLASVAKILHFSAAKKGVRVAYFGSTFLAALTA